MFAGSDDDDFNDHYVYVYDNHYVYDPPTNDYDDNYYVYVDSAAYYDDEHYRPTFGVH